ncbi:type IV secretory system conjugative DNA transfer family protein [Mycoplasma bradburyae]|uniref:type IV secretory system conjugative DNA transfer family protein n=1 Tax=Mycoplasma bradburyae TaxID=2963128 RepID=UPI0020CD6C84|nr:type IV secretory system conjugative DNA transfer family protein [Mycoplasma bradburyae]UTS70560.1 type IV secretory system conjugative DNA transfer family protein [Mycoplasma bradburyae]
MACVTLSLLVSVAKMTIYKTGIIDQIKNYWNWVFGSSVGFVASIFLAFTTFKKSSTFIKTSDEQIHGDAKFLIDERRKQPTKLLEKFNEEYPDKQIPAFVARTYRDKSGKIAYNTILADNKKSTVHTLVLGATGSGKTQRFVYPTLNYNLRLSYENKPNLFVIDVKGEILAKFRDEFKNNDYEVIEVNLYDPFKSHRWNPLARTYSLWLEYLKSKKDSEKSLKLKTEVDSEINNIVEPFFNPNKKGENIEWVMGAEAIVKGVIWYLLEFCFDFITPEKFNLPSIAGIIFKQKENLLEDLLECKDINPTAKCFEFLNAYFIECENDKQRSGYISSVVTGMSILTNDGIKYLLSDNEFKFKTFLSADNHDQKIKPRVIFFVIPDEDTSRYSLATLFINQFYNTAVKISRSFETQTLPRSLLFIGDEFFNIPRVNNMQQKISVARSRNIFFALISQNDAQISKMYLDDAKTIRENCSCHVVLSISSSDISYAKSLSELIGQKSVISKSFSESLDKKSSKNGLVNKGSVSSSLQALNLINANEILSMKSPLGILLKNKTLPSIIKYNAAFEFEEINKIKSTSEGVGFKEYNEQDINYNIDLNLSRIQISENYDKLTYLSDKKQGKLFSENND